MGIFRDSYKPTNEPTSQPSNQPKPDKITEPKQNEPIPIDAPPQPKNQIPFHYLVDFSVIKDWSTYGLNRTLSNLKLETAAQIKEAEWEAKKQKIGRDWNTIVMVIGTIVLIGVIAFMLITNSGAFTEANEKLMSCNEQLGTARGKTNACQAQLEASETVLPVNPIEI